jgi:diacylglycerol kinase (ATP)
MSVHKVVQLFYNPQAGSYSDATIAHLMQAFRETGVRVHLTPSVDTPPVIDPSATHICIAGGDGTVRHVAAALVRANRQLPVAIYPAGTVNLLAREGKIDRRPARLAQALVHGPTRRHSPVKAGDDLFFACASVGPDSLAVASVASSFLKQQIGRFAYVAAVARLLHKWPRHQITLRANGRSWDCEAVYIAKGRYYAGPWSFAPQAKGDDGKLHVVALRRAGRREFLRFCWRMLGRVDVVGDKNVIAFSCTELSLQSDDPLPLQADGDVLASCPVDVSIHEAPVYIC